MNMAMAGSKARRFGEHHGPQDERRSAGRLGGRIGRLRALSHQAPRMTNQTCESSCADGGRRRRGASSGDGREFRCASVSRRRENFQPKLSAADTPEMSSMMRS